MEDPRIISALFISLKMAYYNVLINTTCSCQMWILLHIGKYEPFYYGFPDG